MLFQLYFYLKVYNNNNNLIQKIESFENTLNTINIKQHNNTEYILDDNSLENLLYDYNNLKKNE
jgi:hypothetical protein